ncbi:MAG: porin family protein [Acidobacteriia bacterium]|nr:porin family protein [Terriglobia bacterium]
MKNLAVVLVLACAGSAWGQSFEVWFNGGQSLLSNKTLGSTVPAAQGGKKDDFQLEDGFRFSFRIDLNNDSHFGHEVQYAYNRTKLNSGGIEQGMAIHQGGYNFLLYATPEGTRIRPFATGGVGFANYVPPGSSAAQGGGSNKFGFNYGGGVKMRVTSLFGLRVDVRQYTTPKPFDLFLKEGWLRQTEISAGFGVMF